VRYALPAASAIGKPWSRAALGIEQGLPPIRVEIDAPKRAGAPPLDPVTRSVHSHDPVTRSVHSHDPVTRSVHSHVTRSVHSHVTRSVHSHVTRSVHSHVTRSVHSHDGA
jgi:hypothetical protein